MKLLKASSEPNPQLKGRGLCTYAAEFRTAVPSRLAFGLVRRSVRRSGYTKEKNRVMPKAKSGAAAAAAATDAADHRGRGPSPASKCQTNCGAAVARPSPTFAFGSPQRPSLPPSLPFLSRHTVHFPRVEKKRHLAGAQYLRAESERAQKRPPLTIPLSPQGGPSFLRRRRN